MWNFTLNCSFQGEGSVEKVLTRKHYNRAIRIYQYLYVALTQRRIESFEKYLSSNGNTILQDLVSSDEFQQCLLEVNQSSFLQQTFLLLKNSWL